MQSYACPIAFARPTSTRHRNRRRTKTVSASTFWTAQPASMRLWPHQHHQTELALRWISASMESNMRKRSQHRLPTVFAAMSSVAFEDWSGSRRPRPRPATAFVNHLAPAIWPLSTKSSKCVSSVMSSAMTWQCAIQPRNSRQLNLRLRLTVTVEHSQYVLITTSSRWRQAHPTLTASVRRWQIAATITLKLHHPRQHRIACARPLPSASRARSISRWLQPWHPIVHAWTSLHVLMACTWKRRRRRRATPSVHRRTPFPERFATTLARSLRAWKSSGSQRVHSHTRTALDHTLWRALFPPHCSTRSSSRRTRRMCSNIHRLLC